MWEPLDYGLLSIHNRGRGKSAILWGNPSFRIDFQLGLHPKVNIFYNNGIKEPYGFYGLSVAWKFRFGNILNITGQDILGLT